MECHPKFPNAAGPAGLKHLVVSNLRRLEEDHASRILQQAYDHRDALTECERARVFRIESEQDGRPYPRAEGTPSE